MARLLTGSLLVADGRTDDEARIDHGELTSYTVHSMELHPLHISRGKLIFLLSTLVTVDSATLI